MIQLLKKLTHHYVVEQLQPQLNLTSCDDPAFEKANPSLCGGTTPAPMTPKTPKPKTPTKPGSGRTSGSGGRYRYHNSSLKDVADNSKAAQLSYMTRDGDPLRSNGAIWKLQKMLRDAGESVTPDGIYGPKTKTAISNLTGYNGKYVDTDVYDAIVAAATSAKSNVYRQKTVLYNAGVSPSEYNALSRNEKKQVAAEIAKEKGTSQAVERVKMWFRNRR